MPVERGEGLRAILAGSSNLPLSASNKAQKPLPPGMGFDWKPSDRQTQRDIIQADYRDEVIRRAVKEVNRPPRKPQVESKPVTSRVDIGDGFKRLLEGIKWNLGGREGPGPKDKGYKKPNLSAGLPKEKIPNVFDIKGNAAQSVMGPSDLIPEYVERKTGSVLAGIAAGMLSPVQIGKGMRKMIGIDEPIVQTGRHTQTEGVSDEVVNWLQSRKEQGITRWVVKKDGSATELTGVTSRDYRVPADAVLVDVQKGKPQVLDIGSGVPKAHVEGVLARGAKSFKEVEKPEIKTVSLDSQKKQLAVMGEFDPELKRVKNYLSGYDRELEIIKKAIENPSPTTNIRGLKKRAGELESQINDLYKAALSPAESAEYNALLQKMKEFDDDMPF